MKTERTRNLQSQSPTNECKFALIKYRTQDIQSGLQTYQISDTHLALIRSYKRGKYQCQILTHLNSLFRNQIIL